MPDTITGTFHPTPDFIGAIENMVREIVAEETTKAMAQLADILGVDLDEGLAHEINDSLDAETFVKQVWQGNPAPAPARGIDLEITETYAGDDDPRVIVPNTVRINGQEVLVPEDSRIHVEPIGSSEAVKATITLFLRTLTVATEFPAPKTEPAEPPAPLDISPQIAEELPRFTDLDEADHGKAWFVDNKWHIYIHGQSDFVTPN